MPRRLGQHFLIHRGTLRAIANVIAPQPCDTIIEIGPGHGELTRKLLQGASGNARIIALEKDKELANLLREKFSHDARIEIVEGDALELLPEIIRQKRRPIRDASFVIVGNIPYYITGYLFRILGELERKPRRAVFMIQREVAERICAAPPRMNLLAATVQVWAEPKIIRRVPKTYFAPQPKVESAVIVLETRKNKLETKSEKSAMEAYYTLAKIIFKQPRKTVLNNLLAGLKKKGAEERRRAVKLLTRANINPNDRPQNLSINQLRVLASLR